MTFIEKLKWLFSGESELPVGTKNNGFKGVAGNRTPYDQNGTVSEMSNEEFVKTLMRHPIFIELREWSEYRTKILAIEDRIKRNMAKYYLEIFFGKLQEAIKKAVNEHDTYLDDTVALNNLLIETINDVQKTALAGGVPAIFLDRFTNYLYTQTKILDSTYRDLDRFDYYNTSIARATVRLDLEFLSIRNITSEVESVINDMNGELRLALEGSIFDN